MSRVVFVGNVPYNMGEQALIDHFKTVGQVVGFRLVFDRDTGKAKGYGFCEFADHETALSAVRNLNNANVEGRPLRIDLADSDPFLEGKTTVKGEILDSGMPGPNEPSRNRGSGLEGSEILASIPPGKRLEMGQIATEYITEFIAQMDRAQLYEVLAHMKAFSITHPKHAQQFLSHHPQVTYAIFMGLITTKILPEEVLQRMIAANGPNRSTGPAGPPHPQMPPQGYNQQRPPSGFPMAQPPMQQPQPVHGNMMPPGAAMYPPPMHMVPPTGMPPGAAAAAGAPPYFRPPPAAQPPPMQPPAPANGVLDQLQNSGAGFDTQMLMQIISNLTPAQIRDLPESERATFESLSAMLNAGGVPRT
ncbi:unnamed protein product [Mycena citricolor]|uniref:RRM domain-containing protein n=1 Tax=Mycena citricolor TaxID=2018698 RepID=A0AAD2HIE1_9AGAR|nr:unnamed protein product [Mycena citricolor]